MLFCQKEFLFRVWEEKKERISFFSETKVDIQGEEICFGFTTFIQKEKEQ